MKNRGQLALGLILILLGAWFIAARQIPALNAWAEQYMQGPLAIVAAGILILLVGLVLGTPGMAIPAAIVAGIGGIFYYQQITNDYTSWSYMWTLIIGFVGVGIILAGLLEGDLRRARSGMSTIVTSAVLFVVFAAIFGKLAILGSIGPAILLILVGLWVLIRGLVRQPRGG